MSENARMEGSGGGRVVSPQSLTTPFGSQAPALWLRRLMVSRFRSYEDLAVDVDARPVVLTGPNGAGKTNLLEAISLLGPGRGLRAARLGELERRDGPDNSAGQASSGWAVAAEVETADGAVTLGTGPHGIGNDVGVEDAGDRRLLHDVRVADFAGQGIQ